MWNVNRLHRPRLGARFSLGVLAGLLMVVGTAEAQPYDFCAELDAVLNNETILFYTGEPFFSSEVLTDFLAILDPVETADANGGLRVSTNEIDGELGLESVTPNGILDTSNELQVLAHILNTPDFDNGVLDHATVSGGFEANRTQIDVDIFDPEFKAVFPNFDVIFAAYLTLGGGDY